MLKIWIAGAAGQIGTALNEELDPRTMEVLNTDREELDITNTDEVLRFGEMNRPDVIINCAGITNVTECSSDPVNAFRVNALGARNLSIVAAKIGAKLVQLSTDDVFDGKSPRPYTEFDDTNPQSIYGQSKRAGENYVKEFTRKHFIIRSSWIFGKSSNNFVMRFLKSVEEGHPMAVSAEQWGCPTSARDLARLIVHLLPTNEYGTYHATCKGVCSRYEFAQEILRLAGCDIALDAVPSRQSDEYPARPEYLVLDNFILRIIDLYEMPDWQSSLREFMRDYRAQHTTL